MVVVGEHAYSRLGEQRTHELGLELSGVLTALNLEKGLAALQRQIEESGDGAG